MAMAAASSEEEEEEEEEHEALLACLASPCELHCSSSHCGQRNFPSAFRFSKLQIGVLKEARKNPFSFADVPSSVQRIRDSQLVAIKGSQGSVARSLAVHCLIWRAD
jgi:hypothetical protein